MVASQPCDFLSEIGLSPALCRRGWVSQTVGLWLAGGGKFHRKAPRKISAPAEVLPHWRARIEAEVNNDAIRDPLWFGLYTGMRRDEVLTLRWDRVEMDTPRSSWRRPKPGFPWSFRSRGN